MSSALVETTPVDVQWIVSEPPDRRTFRAVIRWARRADSEAAGLRGEVDRLQSQVDELDELAAMGRQYNAVMSRVYRVVSVQNRVGYFSPQGWRDASVRLRAKAHILAICPTETMARFLADVCHSALVCR
mgnify:CR=1 FL=1